MKDYSDSEIDRGAALAIVFREQLKGKSLPVIRLGLAYLVCELMFENVDGPTKEYELFIDALQGYVVAAKQKGWKEGNAVVVDPTLS